MPPKVTLSWCLVQLRTVRRGSRVWVYARMVVLRRRGVGVVYSGLLVRGACRCCCCFAALFV